MRAKLIRIGNSRGLRIPKAMLEQGRFGDVVELEMQRDRLIVKPIVSARQGWEQAFQAMATAADDLLLDVGTATQWDETEWEW
jgi:antitoxin MazE